ncbi:MAG: SDR family NAD(P)-dependent oxidoreductase, partial [bacterium]
MKKINLNSLDLNKKAKSNIPLEEISKKEMAIIGMAAYLPLAGNKEEYWQNIKNGRDCVQKKIPEPRHRDMEAIFECLKGDTGELRYKAGAYLEEIDTFDFHYFRLTPKEASLMDPCHRLFLQCAMEALEDAGYGGECLKGSKTGVFVGFAPDFKSCGYKDLIMKIDTSLMPIGAPANLPALLPTRISYFLDFKGPTVCLDTACSSSLVAIHLACQSIYRGECELALAGGVKIDLLPAEYGVRIGIESSDGSCRPFDDKADGTGMGEGVGAVLLKPLYKALEDGDYIYSVIKGSAINQDGRSMGITAPHAAAQEEVIIQSWEDAGINPETIAYIEAHGTATNIGDPIEVEGIRRAFSRYTQRKQFCALASVKGNIGHLLEASGMPSLIKASLALKHRQIPPSIHFEVPNRDIHFIDGPVYVNTKLKIWEKDDYPRRCGINSFGMSGTNCHLVLEEAPELQREPEREHTFHLLTLSAKTRQSLMKLLGEYQKYLARDNSEASLSDICFTANSGRGHYNHGLAFLIQNKEDLKEKVSRAIMSGLDHLDQETGLYGEHTVSILPDGKIRDGETSQGKKDILRSEAEKVVLRLLAEGSDNKVRFQEPGNGHRKRKKIPPEKDENSYAEHVRELGRLYVQGADINWNKIYGYGQGKRVPLPVYQFEKHRCWVEIPEDILEKVERRKALHYEVVWIESPIEMRGGAGRFEVSTVLLLKNKSAFSEQVKRKLHEGNLQVIEGEAGTKQDCKSLLAEIKAQKGKVSHIIFMQTLENGPVVKVNELRQSQAEGVVSLYHLLQAMHESDMVNEITIAYISDYAVEIDGSEKCLKPENSTHLGLMRVAEKEFPKVHLLAVDIDEHTTADNILDELSLDSNILLRAYRKGKRYIEQFQQVDFGPKNNHPIEIKEDGVYVITGGAGGIGLVMAEYLAGKKPVNLALISRSGVPGDEEKLAHVRRIMATGARIECLAGDCTDSRRMDEIFSQLRQKYGRINGLIHSAGIIEVDTLLNRSEKDFLTVLAPKIEGTFILDNVTVQDRLDFFILFSSVATLFPAVGQGDYAAANTYLDAYSHYRNKRSPNTLTINWVAWKNVGMSIDTGINQDLIFKALPVEKAVEAFDKVLSYAPANVLIGELNYSGDMVWLLEKYPISLSAGINERLSRKAGVNREGKKPHTSPAVAARPARPAGRKEGDYTETEIALAAIWGKALGFEELDVLASFYSLGGDSILALHIVNSMNKEFNINLHIAELLNYPNIASLAEKIDKDYLGKQNIPPQKGKEAPQADPPPLPLPPGIYSPLEPVEKRACYPTSSEQKRLFFLSQFKHVGTSYHITSIIKAQGKLEKKRLEEVIKKLIQRHEVLRTSFELLDDELVQRVHDEIDFHLHHIQINKQIQLNKQTIDEEDIARLAGDFIQPFDLSKAPLFRIALASKGSEEEHLLLYDLHHIISDGTSIEILHDEFIRLYRGEELPPLRIQYKDFACWQNRLFETEQIKKQERYWLDLFRGEVPTLNLPTDFPRPGVFTFEGDTYRFTLGREDTELLKKMCAQSRVTLFMNLLAAFHVLLHKYSGQEDIIIGCGLSGRSHKDLQSVMGMFINMLAMRNQPQSQKTYKEFLQAVRENCLQAYQNQDVQFEKLIDKLDLPRDTSRNPLFDVSLVIQNFERSKERIEEHIFHECHFEKKTSLFDMTLIAEEIDHEIHFTLEYYSRLFKRETMQRLSSHLIRIIRQVSKNPEITLSDIDILSAEERHQVLYEFNHTEVHYPKDKTIHELFEEQVEKTPEKAALVCEGKQLTYRELNEKANQVARVLREKHIRRDSVVGIIVDRSPEMIIGMMGVLKAGGAYVPIDPAYPQERIRFMREDSRTALILTQRKYSEHPWL